MLRPVPPLPRQKGPEPKAAQSVSNGTGPAANGWNGSKKLKPVEEESGGRGLETGALVWLSDPSQVWTPGEVTESSSSHVVVKVAKTDPSESDEEVEVPHTGANNRLLRRDATIVDTAALQYDDLTNVPELHEAALLQAIADRFQHGRIYTLTGPVLLAVNPFRHMPGLYSPEMLRSFFSAEKLQPHIFSIANRAYQGILDQDESQTVLVSGESGAGKTETTKFVMHFLALTGAEAVVSEGEKPLSRVERQVLRSNPLLEAFGNAQTLRNHNSSRFGKYIELQFGVEDGRRTLKKRLIGTRIRTYLLETVRVIDHQHGERSFHIFYQILAASLQCLPELDEIVRKHLGNIEGPSCFKNLGNSECSELLDDTEDFQATMAAMQTMGFHAHEVADVIRAVLAVLHVGNLQFAVPAQNSEASEVVKSHEAELDPLEQSSELLGLSQTQLAEVLCNRTMQAPGEQVIRMSNTMQQAAECRDALGRHLYHALFKHIVEKTNASIGFKEEATFCGVLDIFGFEFFKINSFEQLCINFTNELLQQYFNNFIFENETALYREEGVPWQDEDFPDNAGIVRLLQSSPSGIFPMLDEECFVIGGTSGSWHRKLIQTHQNHNAFGVVKLQNSTFIVKHFAGPVTYTVDGFLEKNRDRLSNDLLRCLASSEWPFLRSCFNESAEHAPSRSPPTRSPVSGSPKARPSGSPRSKARGHRSTVSSEFRQQLQDLMGQIRTTTPHFVRCIKPNPENRAFVDAAAPDPCPLFDRSSVAEQLRYQGVLEAIRVARAGYPVRYYHFDFLAEFRCIASKNLQLDMEAAMRKHRDEGEGSNSLVQSVRKLLESAPVRSACESPEAVAVGQSRIFLKQAAAGRLRAAQAGARSAAARRLQARHRGGMARSLAAKRLRAVLVFQAHGRGSAVRRRLAAERQSRAASLIAAGLLTLMARRRLHCVRFVCETLQSLVRMKACRKDFLELRQATCRIQSWWRSWLRRRRMRELPKHLLNIQRCWRGAMGRRKATDFRVGLFRLKLALRRLLRLRWAALKHRKWRQGIMASYRGTSQASQASVHLTKADLLQKLFALESEHTFLERQVGIVRQDRFELKTSLDEAKSSSFLRVFGLV